MLNARTKAFALAGAVIAFLFSVTVRDSRPPSRRPPTGYPQLISMEDLPDFGDNCLREPEPESTPISDGQQPSLFSAFEEIPAHAAEGGVPVDVLRPPLRTVSDTDPIYSSVAVDPLRNEVVLIDTNTFGVKTFNRTENTLAEVRASTPAHTIQGPKTHLEFDNGLYIDPKTGDVTTVAADNDWLVTFPHGAEGDTEPPRTLKVTHRAYALAVDEEKQEMYISIQYPPQIAIYHKNASGDEKPIRLIKGEHTLLSDVHGMTIDTKNKLIIANNWGHISNDLVAGTGRFEAPSISIYPLDADGDTPPLRVIQGRKTEMNWPAMISVDPATGDIFVANDLGGSVLVFRESDQGDVAPYRAIKGSKTGLRNPTGVSVDSTNKELWVANLGNSSAEAFALNAKGNQAPLRTIRSAPVTKLSLKFGKPSGTAYDTKREQLLVANWVNHPQIAAFARLAKENDQPVRSIEGQATLISRTMHGMAYDSVRDELVVTSPLAQSILVFRGDANGEEAPVRTIRGPHTQILGTGLNGNDRINIDEVHGEYYLSVLDGIAVFDRDSNGDVPPKRILRGPNTRIKGMTASAPDPVHDRLVVRGDRSLLIFDRLASGDAKPLATIEGSEVAVGGLPHMLRVYGPKGWIIDGYRGGSLGVWSINDRGNVPPHWRIPVRQLAQKGEGASGIDLDPVHKELWVTSGMGNRFMSFYFPEIFE